MNRCVVCAVICAQTSEQSAIGEVRNRRKWKVESEAEESIVLITCHFPLLTASLPVSMFNLTSTSPLGRRGQLQTPHGTIETPFFMPVGTAGTMKGIPHKDLQALGAQILLCNTYHLHLRPGEDIIADAGGLHEFIGWNKPILTDSGGFQVFSFGKKGRTKLTDDGVEFQSHLDGTKLFIGPKESMRIQHALGSDIIMVFDECPPSTAARADIEKAVDRTLKWAQKCKKVHEEFTSTPNPSSRGGGELPLSSGEGAGGRGKPLLFAIVQGGLERDLREKCAQELVAMNFDGYAIGGLAVGESEADMLSVVETICPLLPENKPRYLMGIGEIEQIRTCVAHGIDMFDSVLPQRIARHGTILMSDGSRIRIQNSKFRNAHEPIDADSPSQLSRSHYKSYLHHLLGAHERLGETFAQMQNLGVTFKAMQDLRADIEKQSVPR